MRVIPWTWSCVGRSTHTNLLSRELAVVHMCIPQVYRLYVCVYVRSYLATSFVVSDHETLLEWLPQWLLRVYVVLLSPSPRAGQPPPGMHLDVCKNDTLLQVIGWGCHMHIMWMSHACHVDVTCMSHTCYMVVTCKSHVYPTL